MSSAVLRCAFSRLATLRLDIEVDRLVVRALKAAAPEARRMLVQAGLDAGVRREDTIERAAACFCTSSAFNLSDDLSDGECDYLPQAPAQAVVLILHSLFVAALRDLSLPPDVDAQVHRDLVAAEAAQVLETTTTSWDAMRLRIVTDGIAGSQWSAYLRVMWAGTPMEQLSSDVGRNFGRVALLAGDIMTSDSRYTTLPAADRQLVLEDAMTSLHALASVDTKMTRSVAAGCGPVLAEALAAGSVTNTASS